MSTRRPTGDVAGAWRAATLVVVLALTAGCGGVGDGGRGTYGVPGTPTDDAGDDPGALAPGLGPEGVRDAPELASAHASALANRSFRSRRTVTVRYANGTTVYAQSVDVRRSADGTRYAVDVAVQYWPAFGLDRASAALYSAGAGHPTYERREYPSGPRYRVRDVADGSLAPVARELTAAVLVDEVFDPRFDGRLLGFLLAVESAAVEPLPPGGNDGTGTTGGAGVTTTDGVGAGTAGNDTVATATAGTATVGTAGNATVDADTAGTATAGTDAADGPRRYRVRARSVAPGLLSTPPPVEDPRSIRLRAVVDERGVVRRVEVAYLATYRNRTVSVVESIRIGGVGRTAVPTPSWLADARAATNGTARETGPIPAGRRRT